MKRLILLASLPLWTILILSLGACKTHTLQQLPETRLYFGNGGGFAGAYTEYMLLENGQLFQRESLQGAFVALSKVKRSQAKALFKAWTEQQLDKQNFHHPGNLYRFLRMEEGQEVHRITWGASDPPTPPQLKAFYKSCLALLPSVEPRDK